MARSKYLLVLVALISSSVALGQSNQSDVTGLGTSGLIPVIIILPAPRPGEPWDGRYSKTVYMTPAEHAKYEQEIGSNITLGSSAEVAGGPQSLAPGMMGDLLMARIGLLDGQSLGGWKDRINRAIERVHAAIVVLNERASKLRVPNGLPLPNALNGCRGALARTYESIEELIDTLSAYHRADPTTSPTDGARIANVVDEIEDLVGRLEKANRRFELVRHLYHKVT